MHHCMDPVSCCIPWATFRPRAVSLRPTPDAFRLTFEAAGKPVIPDRAASDRIAINFPPTARRKTVCVKSLLRQHCYLHVQRARKRELIIITGTMPILTIRIMREGMGTRVLPTGSGSRVILPEMEIRVLLMGMCTRVLPTPPVTEGGLLPGAVGI